MSTFSNFPMNLNSFAASYPQKVKPRYLKCNEALSYILHTVLRFADPGSAIVLKNVAFFSTL
ncbi:hypothetical protein OMP06_19171 (plasmid) [Acinetobacter baumannii]|nr:hypothetical protein OMP06_19171 [Acinetobacter baumannii]